MDSSTTRLLLCATLSNAHGLSSSLVDSPTTLVRPFPSQEALAILRIPRNPANPDSDNLPNARKRSWTLVISREHSYNARPTIPEPGGTRHPENPQESGPIQTICATLVNIMNAHGLSSSLVNTRTTLVRQFPSQEALAILRIPGNPANPDSDNLSNARKHHERSWTLVISREHSYNGRTTGPEPGGTRHPENPQKSRKS